MFLSNRSYDMQEEVVAQENVDRAFDIKFLCYGTARWFDRQNVTSIRQFFIIFQFFSFSLPFSFFFLPFLYLFFLYLSCPIYSINREGLLNDNTSRLEEKLRRLFCVFTNFTLEKKILIITDISIKVVSYISVPVPSLAIYIKDVVIFFKYLFTNNL